MLIDLTGEDAEQQAQQAKQAIMKQAQHVLNRRGGRATPPAAAQQPEEVVLTDSEPEEDMAHGSNKKARTNSGPSVMSLGTQDAGAGHAGEATEPSNQTSWQNALSNPMNDMLKALHQERMRRQQQQQQHVQHSGPLHASGEPAENGHKPTTLTNGSTSSQATASGVGKRKAREGSQGGPIEKSGPSQTAAATNTQHAPPSSANGVAGPKALPAPSLTAAGGPAQLTILTYNLWFEEGVALQARMTGLADIILTHQPDVVMFQEVTVNMMRVWAQEHSWMVDMYQWTRPPPQSPYFTLVGVRTDKLQILVQEQRKPFSKTQMGRDVLSIGVAVHDQPAAPALLVATSHLESPIPGQLGIDARKQQVQEGSQALVSRAGQLQSHMAAAAQQGVPPAAVDILWGGDMNWISQQHDAPQLPAGWQDVWSVAHPGQLGPTWDARTNAMLRGSKLPASRLDRFFARLSRWRVQSIEMVGTEPLPGVRAKYRSKEVDVLVSDHYGLLLKLVCSAAGA